MGGWQDGLTLDDVYACVCMSTGGVLVLDSFSIYTSLE